MDKPSGEKCTKQCEQSLNCLEQPTNHINHLEQSANHIVKNDPVLVQYNQDILASFKEAVEAEDSCNSENVPTDCGKPSMPVPTSPLPDVVGVGTTCSPDMNSVLCKRLEGVSLNPSAVATEDKLSADKSILAPSSGDESPCNLQPITAECPPPQVMNGLDNVMNGVPLAPLLQKQSAQIPDSPQSPAKGSPSKSTDSGKKTKVRV